MTIKRALKICRSYDKACYNRKPISDDVWALRTMVGSYYRQKEIIDLLRKNVALLERLKKEGVFICPWCNEEKPKSVQCSKGYCRTCAQYDAG